MRRIWLNRDDFEMFHQDISPLDYEFFRTHVDTFKRMWKEQTRRFWSLFLTTFEHFIWKHGCIKDFPMKSKEVTGYIGEILQYIREQFVYGKVSTAKTLVYNCVIVTQNRHCITILDRAAYAQNPFYMKETREVFRELFGAPNDKKTYMKVLCGLPMYVKFAGSVVVALRRWMDASEINPEDEAAKMNYFDNIFVRHKSTDGSMDEDLKKFSKMSDDQLAELASKCLDREKGASAETTTEPKRKKKKKKTKSTNENDDPVKAEQKTKTSDCTILERKNGTAEPDKTETVDVTGSSSNSSNPCEPSKSDTCKTSDPLTSAKDDPRCSDNMKIDGSVKKKTSDSVDSGSVESEEKRCELDVVTETTEVTNKEGNMPAKPESGNKVKDVARKKEKNSVAKVTAEAESRIDGPNDLSGTKLLLLNEPESKSQLKETSADSAVENEVDLPSEATNTDHTFKDTSLPVSEPVSQDGAKSVKPRMGGGEEPVTKEETEVVKETLNDGGARKKLHSCGLCGRLEVSAKTFKRCQKCRGKSNPKYYCSRECQVKDWKTHKFDHKDDP